MDYHTGLLIIGTQQLLYFLGWLMAAHLIPPMRQIAVRWSLFALVLAFFFFLNSSDLVTTPIVGSLSVLTLLFSVVLARRASEHFFALDVKWREDVPFLLLVAALLYGVYQLDNQDEQTRFVLTLVCLGLAWLIIRTMITVHKAMAREFGNSIAMILHAPSLLLATIVLIQSALLQTKINIVMDTQSGQFHNVSYLLLMLIATGFTHIFYVILIVKRLILQLEIQSKCDPLTNTLNRRGMQEILNQQMEIRFRYNEPFSVLMLDIDHFKRINDEHGHDKGDDVLRKIAQIIRSSVRATDQVARIGGEEFLVILPRTQLAVAAEMAERIRSIIESRSTEIMGKPVTISIGVTHAIPQDSEQDRLLIRADQALYQSKEHGRNRVSVVSHEAA